MLDPAESSDFCHRLVLHGRAVCVANRPQCDKCCMKAFCSFANGEIEPPAKKKKAKAEA